MEDGENGVVVVVEGGVMTLVALHVEAIAWFGRATLLSILAGVVCFTLVLNCAIAGERIRMLEDKLLYNTSTRLGSLLLIE